MKIAFLALFVLVSVVVAGGFFLPATYAVERTATIDASPDEIAPYLQDLKKWQDWTIWNSNENPQLTTTYAGPDMGTGAEMKWTEGTSGTGSLTIAKLGTNGGIEYDLSMNYGMMGETLAKGLIELQPEGAATEVRWKDEFTSDSIVGRWMGLFSDAAVGGMLETNLGKLKSKAEASES